MYNFCAFFLLCCRIFSDVGLVMASDQVSIATMKPIPVSGLFIEHIPKIFDGDTTTAYIVGVQYLPLSFVIDLGRTIPFNTLELSKLYSNVISINLNYLFS